MVSIFRFTYTQSHDSDVKVVPRFEFELLGHKKILVADKEKIEVDCPEPTEGLGVLLAIGQSNSANSAEYLYSATELKGVYNYYNESCYKAASPLIGATDINGEWISKTARNLIDNGTYRKVVVIAAGVDGTPVSSWAQGTILNQRFQRTLRTVLMKYKITDIVWHQGESDLMLFSTEKLYEEQFLSLYESIRSNNINAPVFMSIASRCGESEYPNPISIAQYKLLKVSGIEQGINTDELVTNEMRRDGCHFNKIGQDLSALELAKIISLYHH